MLKAVERLSVAGGVLAAIALVIMPILVIIQVIGRWSGFSLSGAPEYSSYCFAALSFLGLAYSFKDNAHIRVSVLLSGSGAGRRRIEIFCHFVGALLTAYATYLAANGVYLSWRFNDVSQGHDATPLWIPQMAAVIGMALCFLLLFSRLIYLVRGRALEEMTDNSDMAMGE